MALPPSLIGGSHSRSMCISAPTSKRGKIGGPGASIGRVRKVTASEAAPAPTEFTARTVTEYSVPATSPVSRWVMLTEPVRIQEPDPIRTS